jgi:hypothetical protein
MSDLQGLSSNIVLIGFVLLSICCLYLLYSNFKKTRELEELNQKMDDLKTIFFNQQKHNDLTQSHLAQLINSSDPSSTIAITNANQHVVSQQPTQQQQIAEVIKQVNINKNANSVESVMVSGSRDNTIEQKNNKSIVVDLDDQLNSDITNDLKELETLDDPVDKDSSNNDEDIENLDIDNTEEIIDNIYDSEHSLKVDIIIDDDDATDVNDIDLEYVLEEMTKKSLNEVNANLEDDNINNLNDLDDLDNDILDDNTDCVESIKTDPIPHDLDDLDIDLEEIGDVSGDADICEPNDDDNIDLDLDDITEYITDDIRNSMSPQNTNNTMNIEPTPIMNTDATTKQINIDSTSNLTKSTISQQSLEPDATTKNISLSQTSQSTPNQTTDSSKEKTISLDQLLNGKPDRKVDTNAKEPLTSEMLYDMSLKQLKELAKTHKIKANGSKQEIITILSNLLL